MALAGQLFYASPNYRGDVSPIWRSKFAYPTLAPDYRDSPTKKLVTKQTQTNATTKNKRKTNKDRPKNSSTTEKLF